MEPLSQPILPERWAAILDNVQQALSLADADAAKSSLVLDIAVPDWADEAWQQRLAALEEKGRRLRACATSADLIAGEVDTALEASETALRQWLARADAIR